MSKKRLACIGSFGGAAERLNTLFLQSPETWGYAPSQSDQIALLQEPWSELLLRRAFELVGIEDAPQLLIIHGRSPDRKSLKALIREELGFPAPIILADEFSPGEPMPLKFEKLASRVDGAIALVTPDDIGGLASESNKQVARARQNVWVEVGWFWGRLGRDRLLLLKKGDVEFPSDLSGLEHYSYTNDPRDCREEIMQFADKLLDNQS